MTWDAVTKTKQGISSPVSNKLICRFIFFLSAIILMADLIPNLCMKLLPPHLKSFLSSLMKDITSRTYFSYDPKVHGIPILCFNPPTIKNFALLQTFFKPILWIWYNTFTSNSFSNPILLCFQSRPPIQ